MLAFPLQARPRKYPLLLRAVWVAWWVLSLQLLPAQHSNLRDTLLHPDPAGQLLDTLLVAPASVRLSYPDGRPLPATAYRLSGRYLRWQTTALPDSVRARYRVLPFALDRTARLLDSAQLVRETAGLVLSDYNDYRRAGLLDNDSRVRTTGSFSRAISLGNRQDLVLNSAFNLQLEGDIGNGIQVAAAITDESLPVQPEGTTQQLREFDRIFIRLRKNRSELTAGDYELRNPEGYFLRFFRKLEGLTFTTVTGAEEAGADAGAGVETPVRSQAETRPGQLTTTASIAVARGQFTRQQIPPIEGNQGPYQLTGDGGQRFLIILAGTEKIFLDGQPLVRGFDGDYTIDYNLAEITFTARRLITRDSRITAEYEFADQRYVRTLATGGSRYERGRLSAYLNVYSQQDSRTATGDLQLTPAQRAQLGQAGSQPEGIPVLSIDSLRGRAEVRATYQLVDTFDVCSNRDTVFLRVSTAGSFVATFTARGDNQGEYDLDPTRPANERVFRYVGSDPETCIPRGRFAPLIDLVAPEQQQLLTLGTAYRFRGQGAVRIEGSRSRLDRNRFSPSGAAATAGNALRVDFDRQLPLGADSLGWTISSRGKFEYLEQSWNFVNPYRSPEFFRNWNLSNRLGTTNPEAAREQLVGAGLSLGRRGTGELAYDFEQFRRGDRYRGRRQTIAAQLERSGWQLAGNASFLASQDAAERGSFRKPALRLRKTFAALGGWAATASYRGERSLRRNRVTDTLSARAFGFDRYAVGLEAPANERYRFQLQASRRTDQLPQARELVLATRARELTAEGNYAASQYLQIGSSLAYRDLDVAATELVEDRPDRTFLGRLDVRASAARRSLRTQTTWQVGNGREARVDFQYLFVGPGLGQYIWQDSLFNNDGRIQPNEMVLSPFPDIADYVRVSVFNNTFIQTNNVLFNQQLNWDPARLWKSREGFRRWLRKLSLTNSIRIDRKTREAPDIQAWNPFQLAIADSSLVALTLARRHSLFFNRAHPRYDIQLSQSDRRNRRVLTTGFEASQAQEWQLTLRYRPHQQLSVTLAATAGQRSADSEFFNEKDFAIQQQSLAPALDWQPGPFRLLTTLLLGAETNQLAGGNGEQARRLEVQFEGNYRNWLTVRFRRAGIDFTGDARSPVGFALLQGLQPGRNLLWNVGATRQLGEYLQLTLSYEGRQTGNAATVHVGRAAVQAFF